MKKILILTSIVLSLLLSACGGNVIYDGTESGEIYINQPTVTPIETVDHEAHEFRNLNWGMTLSEVVEQEGVGYSTVKQGVIRYNNLFLDDFPVESEYTFSSGKLSMCIYYTTHEHQDISLFLEDYEELKEKYEEKYGNHLYYEEKWADNVTPSSSKKLEELENGNMMFRTGWEIDNSRINLVLFNDTDGKIKIGIRYMPINILEQGSVAPTRNPDI